MPIAGVNLVSDERSHFSLLPVRYSYSHLSRPAKNMAAEAENVAVPPAPESVSTEAQNEAARQTALGAAPRRPKVAFEPKPVTFLPLDIIKFIDELASAERFASNKTSAALDAVLLGSFSTCLLILPKSPL